MDARILQFPAGFSRTFVPRTCGYTGHARVHVWPAGRDDVGHPCLCGQFILVERPSPDDEVQTRGRATSVA
jgi:hypothetical protein